MIQYFPFRRETSGRLTTMDSRLEVCFFLKKDRNYSSLRGRGHKREFSYIRIPAMCPAGAINISSPPSRRLVLPPVCTARVPLALHQNSTHPLPPHSGRSIKYVSWTGMVLL